MNCKSVQELLPLYVSRDLEEGRTRLVTAHVQTCAECGNTAAEYHETQRLLRDFAPPAFSESVYAGIRQRIMREIETEAPAVNPSSFERLFAGWFRPRLSWAVASVLLLTVGLFAFYFIVNRGRHNGTITAGQTEGSPQKPGVVASKSPSIDPPRESNESGIKSAIPGKGSQTAKAPNRPRRSPMKQRGEAPIGGAPTLAVNGPSQRLINTQVSPATNSFEPEAVPSSEKVLRMEMQTRDPNIRIIWLTPQRTKHDSPGKVSKGV
ncbi:MAG: zf-HC2 domain-containing protein [Acidobacteriota bacterium]